MAAAPKRPGRSCARRRDAQAKYAKAQQRRAGCGARRHRAVNRRAATTFPLGIEPNRPSADELMVAASSIPAGDCAGRAHPACVLGADLANLPRIAIRAVVLPQPPACAARLMGHLGRAVASPECCFHGSRGSGPVRFDESQAGGKLPADELRWLSVPVLSRVRRLWRRALRPRSAEADSANHRFRSRQCPAILRRHLPTHLRIEARPQRRPWKWARLSLLPRPIFDRNGTAFRSATQRPSGRTRPASAGFP
jgi:hypothetical protein